MYRFFAPKEAFSENLVRLDSDESRHLHSVLRLKKGDRACVFDGEGGEFDCVVSADENKAALLEIQGRRPPLAPESPLRLTIAASMLKGDKFDLVVQKAVELGVTRVIPLETARCDVRIGDAEKRRKRLQKIALGAAKQAGRATLMKVEQPQKFTEFAASAAGAVYFFSERDGDGFPEKEHCDELTAVFGPEGGWDDAEIQLARVHGFPVITLGGRVLRAETAAIVMTALLQHKFGDIS